MGNACVHTWAVWENECEGLEIDLFKIKSLFLFIRSYTEVCYIHFLHDIVTNVARSVHQALWQALGKWKKYLKLGGHYLLVKIPFTFSKVPNLLVTKHHFTFHETPSPSSYSFVLVPPPSFFTFPLSKCAFAFTWKWILVKLQPLTSVIFLGHIQDIDNKLHISAYFCLTIQFVLSFCKRLLTFISLSIRITLFTFWMTKSYDVIIRSHTDLCMTFGLSVKYRALLFSTVYHDSPLQ